MTNDKQKKDNKKKPFSDVMHGRSFAGTQWAADQEEQTRDIERASGARRDESDDFVTDAELEAREQRGRGRDEGSE